MRRALFLACWLVGPLACAKKPDVAAPDGATRAAPERGASASETVQPSRSDEPASTRGSIEGSAEPHASAPAEGGVEWTAGIVHRENARSGAATLRALRFARHPGFDRVVFEFDGRGLPSRHVEYVDKPVRDCGAGEPRAIEGDGWLSITFEPANAHTERGQPTLTAREMRPGLPIVREIELTCDFEAQVTIVLGVAHPNRYRVLELDGPPRFVVDIRH